MKAFGILIKNSVGGNFNNEEMGFLRGVLMALGVKEVSEDRFASEFTSFVFIASDETYKAVIGCLNAKKASYKEMKITLEFK
jgi:hypothetical protein